MTRRWSAPPGTPERVAGIILMLAVVALVAALVIYDIVHCANNCLPGAR